MPRDFALTTVNEDVRMFLAAVSAGQGLTIAEHDFDIMALADHIIGLGPGAGAAGGSVIYQGDYDGLTRADTPTGRGLREHQRVERGRRETTEWIEIRAFDRLRVTPRGMPPEPR